ncbi:MULTISPECIES: YfgM family protein [unclassified Colwellia]|uniref:YfgM family protein n=1 Tax=unclassified Colwellia TaxID=196834 RepID=UPI0015F75A4B|nr:MULTISPECIES: tetratricopeptide repeat protein [unclassified Colwellia]MBA6233226.1 tetratricopeptide repeat protein [Colwellia sp. MB02u-7]MBA6236316.1 tetratricopeptide repeat protein [Colwellia sp. MB02u-11]MBA6256850.1 tetratricopeptide repeat protein [Colwellia sp. MB3u-28]MBA6261144.1 tetratricopeptide repeat protein [Colwellia sp. MB3u-41]MBA6298284.1 tetratricopeptide repeat protein [Colwellia sp. MB3u-22]
MDVYQTEEQQVEAIKGFWKENGTAVIAGLVLGFAGFIGFNYYKEAQLANEVETSDAYQTVMESAGKKEKLFSTSANKFITENKDSSYASLTAFALAKEAATHKDWTQVAKHLTTAIESATNQGVKAIASVRLARVQIQLEQYTEALATISVTLPESFKGTVEETRGDAYFKQGKIELARNAYQAALDVEGQANNSALQMKLNDLAQLSSIAK